MLLKPRTRAGLCIARRGTETLVFSARPESFDAISDEDGAWFELLGLANGTRDIATLGQAMAARGRPLTPPELAQAVTALVTAGFLVEGANDADRVTKNQVAYLEQYARTAVAALEMQRRIEAAEVVVLGAGGIGSWLSLAIVQLGVARLTVIDPDRIERVNLGRQPYTEAAVGRRKIEALGLLLRERSSRLRYQGVDLSVRRPEDLAALAAGAALVCCCADEPSPAAVAELVAEACIPLAIPHLGASYHGAVVRVGPTWTPQRRPVACAGCLAKTRERDLSRYGPTESEVRDARRTGAPTPVTVSQSMFVAAIAAQEALHVLAGLRPATTNRVFTLDLRTLRSYRTRIAPQPTCRLCGDGAQRPADLHQLLERR
jgi:bacteriocin biosynthesis cyclodehydratase domain-containing protein